MAGNTCTYKSTLPDTDALFCAAEIFDSGKAVNPKVATDPAATKSLVEFFIFFPLIEKRGDYFNLLFLLFVFLLYTYLIIFFS